MELYKAFYIRSLCKEEQHLEGIMSEKRVDKINITESYPFFSLSECVITEKREVNVGEN